MTNSEKHCLPAFDDLRHLRRKTEKGYLIVHPLVHHRAPDKPGSTPGTALTSAPAGYTTTADLAARYHLPKARIRRILRASSSPKPLPLAASPQRQYAKPLAYAAAASPGTTKQAT